MEYEIENDYSIILKDKTIKGFQKINYKNTNIVKYEGYIKNGLAEGNGTLYNKDGTLIFNGTLKIVLLKMEICTTKVIEEKFV